MDAITEIEEKINETIKKLRLLLINKGQVLPEKEDLGQGTREKIEELEEENERLKKKLELLLQDHETDLKTVDKLVEKLNALLEEKNGGS